MIENPLDNILSILDDHHPADGKEYADIEIIRRMIPRYPNLLWRECVPGHITGSALVMDRANGRILLHYHKKLDRWLQFGGHLDAHETVPSQAALREAREESGLPDLAFHDHPLTPCPFDIDVHTIPERNGVPDHLHLDFRYLVLTSSPDRIKPGAGESQQLRWLDLAEISTFGSTVSRELLRMMMKARDLYTTMNGE